MVVCWERYSMAIDRIHNNIFVVAATLYITISTNILYTAMINSQLTLNAFDDKSQHNNL